MLEARLRREGRRLLGTAEDADQPSHLGERLAACLLDDLERLALALLLRLEQPAHTSRLHGHHADAVADDVVELARDPRTLLGHRCARLLLACPLESLGTLLRLVGFPQLVPEAEPDRPGDAEDDAGPHEVTDAAVRVVPRDDRIDAEENGEPGNCLPEVLAARRT